MSGPVRRRKLDGWLLVPALVVAAAGAWVSLDPGFRFNTPKVEVATALPKDEFERRVRDYILNNPEVIMEAARRFEQRQRAAEESEATAVLKARADEIFRDKDSPVGGNPTGDVSLVEFFDYNCPRGLQGISDTGAEFDLHRQGGARSTSAGQVRRVPQGTDAGPRRGQ